MFRFFVMVGLILAGGLVPIGAQEFPPPKFAFRDIDFLGTWKIRGTLAGTYLEGMWDVKPDGTGSMVYIATVREDDAGVKREEGESAFNWKVDRDGYLIIHFKPRSTLSPEVLRRPCFFVPMEIKREENSGDDEKPELIFRQLIESFDGESVQLAEELKIRQLSNPFRIVE